MRHDSLPASLSINSVRLSGGQIKQMLDLLDSGEDPSMVSLREHPRFRYRVRSAVVYTKQGGKDVAFIVPTRNVSSGGIAFLHSQMMHVGQECVVQLATKDGSFVMVPGKVVRCTYVKRMMHEIAVQFAKPIDVSSLLSNADTAQVSVANNTAEARHEHPPDEDASGSDSTTQ